MITLEEIGSESVLVVFVNKYPRLGKGGLMNFKRGLTKFWKKVKKPFQINQRDYGHNEDYCLIPRVIQIVGTILCLILGIIVGAMILGPIGALLLGPVAVVNWAMVYVAFGFRRIEENRYVVWECLGKFRRISKAGITIACFPPFIDKPAENGGEGDFLYHELSIAGEGEDGASENLIDFRNGGTGKPAGEIVYRVIDKKISVDKGEEDGAYFYTYTVADTESRITAVILGLLRQVLQTKTVEEACVGLPEISKQVRDDADVKQTLLQMGVELHKEKGVVITDIQLDEQTINNRERVLTAETDISVATMRVKEASLIAKKEKETGAGFMKAVLQIYKSGKAADPTFTIENARELYLTRTGLEVLSGHQSSNLTLVSPNLKDTITSIRVDGHRVTGD